MPFKEYTDKTVLEATVERISYIFDEFESIVVSISGGKDSEVLCYLALQEARKRGRKIGIFFLDEEVVYKSTIEMVEYLMSMYPENTNRFWLQIPFNLTNSTSLLDGQLDCWEQAKKPLWMHKRSENNILRKTWSHETHVADKNKGFGFYDVMYNFEYSFENTAFLVGLRADEYAYNDAYGDFYFADVEPWEQNITTLCDFGRKWQDMLPKKTPVPTPVEGRKPNDLGVYEGAGYMPRGVYRPTPDCRMRTNECKAFCPVCQRAIERLIQYYTQED